MPDAYTYITKPTTRGYTNVNPIGKQEYDDSAVTYDSSSVFYDSINPTAYTSVAKISSEVKLVQSVKSYPGGNTMQLVYPRAVTAGNLLVLCVSANEATDVINFTDSANNTWTKAINVSTTLLSAVSASVYYATANSNVIPTLTVNGTDIGGSAYEYKGAVATVNASNATTLSTFTASPTASTLTTTDNTLVVAFAAQEDGLGTFSACGNGFTLRQYNEGHVDAVADSGSVPKGSYAANFNYSLSIDWVILQVAFTLGGGVYTNIAKPTT